MVAGPGLARVMLAHCRVASHAAGDLAIVAVKVMVPLMMERCRVGSMLWGNVYLGTSARQTRSRFGWVCRSPTCVHVKWAKRFCIVSYGCIPPVFCNVLARCVLYMYM